MNRGKTSTIGIILLSAICLLLLVSVVQLNALEKRASTQSQELRALGESTEKLAGEISRLKVGGTRQSSSESASAGCELGKLLHPEVADFLKPQDTHWPPPGATLTGVFKRGWDLGDPKGFNPLLENAGDLSDQIEHYVHMGIAARNIWTDPNKFHGELGCRVEITDDYKEYTVYLKRGVYWHQPSGVDVSSPRYAWLAKRHPLTAEDFVFALDMIVNPQVESGALRNYYTDVEGAKAIDEHTLVVRWKTKTYQSLAFTLGLAPLPKFLYAHGEDGKPFPKETLGLRFNQHWYNNKGYVGVGPYRFAEYKPGMRMTLTRDEEFQGEKPAIKEIQYPIYTDRTLGVLKLKSGELNFTELRPGQYREEVLDWQAKPKNTWPKNNPFLNGSIECGTVTQPVYRYLGWNADKALFKDKRVRRAMTHALNRQEILDKVFVGLGELTTGPFLPWSNQVDPNVKPFGFDLKRSKELLAEAGWTDSDGDGLVDKVIDGKKTPFEFMLLLYGNKPEYTAMANIFKEDLLKVGVKMGVAAVDWSLMQKRMEEKNFDAYTGGWGVPWDSDPYQIWHSSQAELPKGSNRVGFRNKRVDALIEKLRATFDQDERGKMFQELHRILHEEQPYTFFFYQKYVYCWRSEVKNVQFAKDRPSESYFPWWVAAE